MATSMYLQFPTSHDAWYYSIDIPDEARDNSGYLD